MVKLLVAPFAFQFSFQYCLHFSEIHSTLLVNFHLQRHMGNFVIQVGNLAKIMSVKIIWFSADTFFPRNSELVDDEVVSERDRDLSKWRPILPLSGLWSLHPASRHLVGVVLAEPRGHFR